jgi:hypothetical protein
LVVASGCVENSGVDAAVARRAPFALSSRPRPPTIDVLEPGQGRAHALRYRFDKAVPFAQRIDVTTTTDGRVAPTVRVTVHVQPKGEDPDQNFRFEFEIVEGPPALLHAWGTAAVTDRGIIKEFGWNPRQFRGNARTVLVDVSRALQRLYPPLPEGEVSKGARWEATSDETTTAAGSKTRKTVAMERRAIGAYTLRDVSDDTAELDFEESQTWLGSDAMSAAARGQVSVRFSPPMANTFVRLTMNARVGVDYQRRREDWLRTSSDTTSQAQYLPPAVESPAPARP